jgi:xeroderma pigmentosum group C-complementing protein
MRIGRIVKPRQEPLKWVKQRAVTLDRRRAQELANIEGKDPIQQGLYAEWQTEIFTPPPIENVSMMLTDDDCRCGNLT